MQRRNRIILEKILGITNFTLRSLEYVSEENFLSNEEKQHSTVMTIIRIGELVKNLTQDFRMKNSHIAWKDIAGFRDVAAHKYDTLIMSDVYATAKNDFPQLKMQIEKILEVDD